MSLGFIYLICMYKKDLALNNLQWLICHKTKPSQAKSFLVAFSFLDALSMCLFFFMVNSTLRDSKTHIPLGVHQIVVISTTDLDNKSGTTWDMRSIANQDSNKCNPLKIRI